MTKQKRSKEPISGKEILKKLKPWKKDSTNYENKVQLVIVDQSIYSLDISNKDAAEGYPDCEQAKCEKYKSDIIQICKEETWPTGHTILICSADGHCCFCHCP